MQVYFCEALSISASTRSMCLHLQPTIAPMESLNYVKMVIIPYDSILHGADKLSALTLVGVLFGVVFRPSSGSKPQTLSEPEEQRAI